jgi:hypothetical protein
VTAGVLDRARARRILGSRHARRGELRQVTVLDSRSMAPTFVGECRATTDWRIPPNGPRPGQIVLAGWGDLLILHRVVATAIDPDGRRRLLQMADNYEPGNPMGATWLTAEHVLAVVRSVEGADGRLVYSDESRLCQGVDRLAAGLGYQLWQARYGVGTGRAGRVASVLVGPVRTRVLTWGAAAVRLRLRFRPRAGESQHRPHPLHPRGGAL